MASWYEAPSLGRLKQAVDLRWPGRDRRSDGSIGDSAHQARTSDHNPDRATGVVRARDLDKDGLHVPTVLAAAFLHPSVSYVIHNRKIYHADRKFKPAKYTGTNPHTGHIHISIFKTKTAENSKVAWAPVSSAFKWPELKLGNSGVAVRQLQAYLNGFGAALAVDGQFGAGTRSAVLAFQRAKKLDVDGVVGPQTSKALRTR
jgi:hypothetical protein